MRVTLFTSALDRSASTHELTWEELCNRIVSPPTYGSKSDCPLIKLAVFGNAPSPKGFMRHDANVTAITGVELDYDAEAVGLDEAADKLTKAGVRCILYTSASHSPDKPRWRVFAPLTGEHPPEHRRGFAAWVDAILGEIVARESYALSQAYYVGQIDGVEYQTRVLEGRCVDELTEAVATPLSTAAAPDVPEWRHVPLENLPIDDATRSLIRDGAAKGKRSEAELDAANALARARVAPDDILRILADPAYGISAKALEGRRTQAAAMERLARYTVKKALAAFPPADVVFADPAAFGAPAKRVSLFASAGELVDSNEPINWQITDILECPTLGMLFGDPGAGKSFVALDWAASIATGTPWQERTVTRGAVAYIAGEGFAGIKRRLKAWAKHRDKPLKGVPLYVSRRAVDFGNPATLNELHGELEALPERPALIVIDTLARATPGMDENSAKEVGAFIGACDRLKERFGATVLVVHHSGHGDKRRAKGSIAIKGAVDFEAVVARDPKRDGVLFLESTKMKDGEPFKPIYLRFEPVELPPTDDLQRQASAVLVQADEPMGAFKLEKSDELLRDILAGGTVDKTEVRNAFLGRYTGVAEGAEISQGAKVKTFDRALKRAMERGLIVADPDADTLTAFSFYRTDRRTDTLSDTDT